MINPRHCIFGPKWKKGMERLAGIGLVAEDIPAGRIHPVTPLFGRSRRDNARVGTEEYRAEERGVEAGGAVLAALGRARLPRRREVEEPKVGARSGRNEPIKVDRPRRRWVMVRVD